MLLITVFLIVLIAALVVGNVLLSVAETSSKETRELAQARERADEFISSAPSRQQPANRPQDNALKSQTDFQNCNTVLKRISRLSDFRNEARIEIQALTDRVGLLEERVLGKKIDISQGPEKEDELLQEKIHNLVYRSGKAR